MKKIFAMFSLFALLFVVCAPHTYVQTTPYDEKITVKTSDLTVDQLAKIKVEQELAIAQKKIQTYGNWVGVGGEIGTAVKEGLNAVVDVSERFGKTDVGKFTLIMIAWKVIGKDAVRIILGLLLILVSTIFIFVNYRKNFTTRKILIKGSHLLFWQLREYKLIEPNTYDGFEFVRFLNLVLLIGSYGIAYAIMFG